MISLLPKRKLLKQGFLLVKVKCSRRACKSCSTSGTCRVNLVTNQIITREWVRDREVLTISGTNKWSFWHRYYITVNQVMEATVTFSKWWLHLHDKRDDFIFLIVNFPFIHSTIPAAHAIGVYISLMIGYFRACGSYHDFLAANTEATETRVHSGEGEVITSKMLRSPPWLGLPLCNICVKMTTYFQRDVYSNCMCCWNGAMYKWKVHNEKNKIISFVVKFRS
jgi:hypothetical protein